MGIGVLHLPNLQLIPLVGSGEPTFRRGLMAAAFGSAPRRSASLGEIPSLLDPTYASSPGSESCLLPTMLKQPMASFQDPAPPQHPQHPVPGCPIAQLLPSRLWQLGRPSLVPPNEISPGQTRRLGGMPSGSRPAQMAPAAVPGGIPTCPAPAPRVTDSPAPCRCRGLAAGEGRREDAGHPARTSGGCAGIGVLFFLNKIFSTLWLSLVTR